MSGIRKRAPIGLGITEFRHPAFFEDNPAWQAAERAYDEYVLALATWAQSGKDGNAPDPAERPAPVTPPDLEMFKDTRDDVVWIFSTVKTGIETDHIVGLMTSMAIDWKDLTKQYNEGEGDVTPVITEPQRSAYRRAELTVMTVETKGEFWRIPADYTVGDFKRTKDTTPHLDAGQMAPIDPTWLRIFSTDQVSNEELLSAAHMHLVQSYVRRSSVEEERFPQGVIPLPDAGKPAHGRGKGGKVKA